MEQTFAPLVVFAYKRANHLERTLQALNNNMYASETVIYIYSDGCKDDSDNDAVNNVRKVINDFSVNSKYKKTNIIYSEANKGLANSIIFAVTDIINKYDKVIVVEDDLITSTNFLAYMNAALEYYEKYDNVWSIAGYSPMIRLPRKLVDDVYMCKRAGSWGWATWSDRWNKVDWSFEKYEKYINSSKVIKEFKRNGYDMPEMLKKQLNGQIDSWAIRFCFVQCLENALTINPVKSKIQNIGVDGSGTHKVNENKWQTELDQSNAVIFNFANPNYEKWQFKAYYDYYSGNAFQRCYKNLKGFFYKIVKVFF